MDIAVEVEEEEEEGVAGTGMAAERDGTEEAEEAREDTVLTLTRTEEVENRGTVLLHT